MLRKQLKRSCSKNNKNSRVSSKSSQRKIRRLNRLRLRLSRKKIRIKTRHWLLRKSKMDLMGSNRSNYSRPRVSNRRVKMPMSRVKMHSSSSQLNLHCFR